MVDKRTPHVYVEFEAKFGELWATRTLRETWWTREQFTFMWNLRQNLESSGHQEKYKSHTSVGRKFAPVEGLSHDLVCTGSIYHVHFAWQVWHGQLSPRFKFNKLKSFSGVEIDQNHVDKRILGGKGFAVGRLKRHNFCPASVWSLLIMFGYDMLWHILDVVVAGKEMWCLQWLGQSDGSTSAFYQTQAGGFDDSCGFLVS